MMQLPVCEECFAKNVQCKVKATFPRYLNNYNRHDPHDMLNCGFCAKEIPCQFCGPVGKNQIRCPKCDKTMLKGDYPKHKRMHDDDRIFKCTRCPKGFVQKNHLVEHLRIHTGEKPYQCQACGKSFRVKNQLITHQRPVHSELRPFICQACSATYKTSAELNKHMHAVHEAKYPPCVECNQVFYRRNDLREHMAIHHHITNVINDVANGTLPIADAAPFYCGTCGEPFINECFKLDHERANNCEEDEEEDSPPKKKKKFDDDLADLITKFAELKINDD